jgi:hypothetical protein
MGRGYSTHEEKRRAYRISVGKPEGKRPLGRPRRRWGIIYDESWRDRKGWYGLNLSGSGYGPVEGCFEHGNEPSGFIKC